MNPAGNTVAEQDRTAPGIVAAGGVLAVSLTITLVAGLDTGTALTDPAQLRRTISEYGLGTGAQALVFTTAVALLAVGSAAVLATLLRRGLVRLRSTATAGLTLWILGLATIAIFPKQDHSQPDTMGGDLHRIASLVAFVSLPIAASALARRWRQHPTWGRFARRTGLLAGVSAVMFAPLVYAVTVAITTGTRWWEVLPLGYVERGLLLAEVVTMLAIGGWSVAKERPSAGFHGSTPDAQPSLAE
jgi:hypothetical membrane protein